MTGKGKKYKTGKKYWVLFGLLAFFLAACSSKETILLEEEDLVRTSGTSGNAEDRDGVQAAGWQDGTVPQSEGRIGTLGQPEEGLSGMPGQPGAGASGAGQPEEGTSGMSGQQGTGTSGMSGQPEEGTSGIPGQPGERRSETAGQGMQEGSLAAAGGQGTGNGLAAGMAENATLFVHICGEVMEPGVYELPAGSRIFEAVEAAGGFTEAASRSYVNLALELKDGWKVEIPVLGEEPGIGRESSAGPAKGEGSAASANMQGITGSAEDILESAAEGTEAVPGPGGSRTDGGTGQAGGLVDINTATKQELCTLPGIGETRAESIISYREKNGGFARIEDIMKVEGIKEGMFSKMKDRICVRGVE